jgi:hypothetical protein
MRQKTTAIWNPKYENRELEVMSHETSVMTTTKKSVILGKHLVSAGLQMRCFGATEEFLTLTKRMRIDQCERVKVN